MNCDTVGPLLAAYLDNELSEAEQTAVRRHTSRCAACARALSEIKYTITAMRSLPEVDVPADFRPRLRQRLAELPATRAADIAARELRRVRPRRTWAWWGLPSTAVAAALMLGIVLFPAGSPAVVDEPEGPAAVARQEGQSDATTGGVADPADAADAADAGAMSGGAAEPVEPTAPDGPTPEPGAEPPPRPGADPTPAPAPQPNAPAPQQPVANHDVPVTDPPAAADGVGGFDVGVAGITTPAAPLAEHLEVVRADVALQVADTAAAAQDLQELAAALEGQVEIEESEGLWRAVLRVAPEHLDAALDAVAALGAVTAQDQSSQDVGWQVSQLRAELAGLQERRTRLVEEVAAARSANNVDTAAGLEAESDALAERMAAMQEELDFLERATARATINLQLAPADGTR